MRPVSGGRWRTMSVDRSSTAKAGVPTVMAPPNLTPERRTAALVRARAARTARMEMLAAVKTGEITAGQVLARAETDPMAARTRVTALLQALPGLGPIKAHRLLTHLGIAPSRRVGGLGPTQRATIVDRDL